MGTRGAVAVGNLKKWRGLYNHWDSYPSGLGKELYEHVMRQMLIEKKSMADIAEGLLAFDDWRNYLAGGICEYCGKMAGQPHSIRGDVALSDTDKANGKYPDPEAKHHKHNDISSPEEIAKNHITSDDPDPLFIEWVYILNPEKNVIHVLKHQSCPDVKLKKPMERNPDGTPKEYTRKLSGGRYHYGHCVYKHVYVGDLTFDKTPDWDSIECGELFQYCSHYAYHHFPELEGTPSEHLGTTEYLSEEPTTDFNYAVAYIIAGEFYWKGGSGYQGGDFAARLGKTGSRPDTWYQSVSKEYGGKSVAEFAVARTRATKGHLAMERVPAPGVVWVFPPTLHHDWTSVPKMNAEAWAHLKNHNHAFAAGGKK